ncbi:MAG: DUF1853 family protein [Bacteroidota bacterium]
MSSSEADNRLRHAGFLATPTLWQGEDVSTYEQIELPVANSNAAAPEPKQGLRLGKLVETYVCDALKRSSEITWITDGLQIQHDKRTIGELDALYHHNGRPIHLEVAYKFYLYDTRQTYANPLAHWIGPNRKDNLALKLRKLHNKQFPLLHHPLTRTQLASFQLSPENIEQRLCFRGQLFVPYQKSLDVHPLNQQCVAGFYCSITELNWFAACTFFIPNKLDWLVVPHRGVAWRKYAEVVAEISASVGQQRSPLVWIRHPDERIERCFVVFW